MPSSRGTRPLRVAMVVRPAMGGIRRHVSLLLSHLDRTRFAPTLFAPADFTLDTPLSEVPHIPIPISPRLSPLADLRSIHQLAQLLRQNFDIVHAHGLRAALIGVLAAKQAGVPALFTAHNLVPELGFLSQKSLNYIGRSSAQVIAVSQAVAETLRLVGIPAQKMTVIPNGIDLAPFDVPQDVPQLRATYNLPANASVVVAIGRFAPEKGFDLLLEAFKQLLQQIPNAHLLLAGSGAEEAKLRELAHVANLPIQFTGHLSEVAPLLSLADVVAIPSRQEGQGIVALEAMAARKPIVATQVGGLAETVLDGQTGLLVPPENPQAFAQALADLLQNPERRNTMGELGRQQVEQHYTLPTMLEKLETLYLQI